jgi:hypothetical protein
MSRPDAERSRSKGKTPALACIAALLIGLLAGYAVAPSPPDLAATPAGVVAARSVSGVPVGFAHTQAGAAGAVAAYERAFASPAILRPGVLRARIEAAATPDYAAQMLATNAPGATRLARGPLGVGLRGGVRTLYLAVPIGYRVESYEPARARVLTWGFTLLGNAATLEPAAYFGLSRTEVVWMGGRWRIAATRSGFGPTPKLATRPGPLGAFGVAELTRKLRTYALAP